MCSGDQNDLNINSSEVLLDNISQEFFSKEELGKPVSEKFSKTVNTLFLNDTEEEKFKTMNKMYCRPENCAAIVAPKVNSEIWNENLQASHRMTDINLRKVQLLNVSAAYTVIEACEKVVCRLSKYKQDLSKELLTLLVDSLGFIGNATKDANQLRRDILKSRLPAKMKQLTKNVPAESELFFGDDLIKRISQINNTNSASAKAAFRPTQNSGRYNKNQAPYNTTSNNHQQSKNGYPPEELCYREKGKQAEQLQELQELNLVSSGDKNIKNFLGGNLKYNFTIWLKITSDKVILDIIKNGLKINFKVRPGITSAPKIPHSEQEIKIINKEIKKI